MESVNPFGGGVETVLLGCGVVLLIIIAAIVFARSRSEGVTIVPTAPGGASDTPGDLAALLARGKKIEAIKQVRDRTGMGLKEAKDYVEALERGQAPPLPAMPLAEPAPAAMSDGALLELVRRGKKIEAIKQVREQTGMGLKEARDYVDALEARAER
jgi:ribosomal protein L7/L12